MDVKSNNKENGSSAEINDIHKFDCILDKDEAIVKVFKPNKVKMYWSRFSFIIFLSLIAIIPFLVLFIILEELVVIPICLIIWLVIIVISAFFIHLEYKNTFYAYSNKRVIIRKGFFGVDYKSLDMTMIGAINVDVTWLDKIVHEHTGTICFGSMAGQINIANIFAFENIYDPYGVYKEIKAFIDETKLANK